MIHSLEEALASKSTQKTLNDASLSMAQLIRQVKESGKIIAIFGNGGSAADAQHFAAELVCTYSKNERQAYPAIALTTDTSIITAWSNDFSFETIFSRQLLAFANVTGLAIGLSTSGKSRNVLEGFSAAKSFGSTTLLISGRCPGHVSDVDQHIQFNTSSTPVIQTLTQILYHNVCEHLETS